MTNRVSVSQQRFPANHSLTLSDFTFNLVYLSSGSRQTIARPSPSAEDLGVYLSSGSRQTIAFASSSSSEESVYLSGDSPQIIATVVFWPDDPECISAAVSGKP
jgi:hypothetical protein